MTCLSFDHTKEFLASGSADKSVAIYIAIRGFADNPVVMQVVMGDWRQLLCGIYLDLQRPQGPFIYFL